MERIKKYEPLWGSWRVKRRIGEGSFGAVYEVEKSISGMTSFSAVKLISFNNSEMLRGISLDATLSAEELEVIKRETAKKNVREAALMDKLQGRANIVTSYDFDIIPGENTTDVLIRMELLTNLNEYFSETEKSNDMVIKLGIDICKALEVCAKEKIVHRDIKPENIFVNKDGDFKLGDFGLSRKMSKSASMSLRKSKGTPLYMSPEAFGWGMQVDHTSDIYSLGIVMYRLLNDGNIPFGTKKDDFDDEDYAIGMRLNGEEIIPPAHEKGRLWEIIQKTCRFKKEERYQNASDMRKDLELLKNSGETCIESKNEACKSEIQQPEPVPEPEKTSEKTGIVMVGDIISFGSYPQGNSAAAGRKPVEWVVMKKESRKMLLVSKDILDCRVFHRNRTAVTWETSDMRQWLNGPFYESVFHAGERERIQRTSVKTAKNPKYNTAPGKDTGDLVFLLDIEEAESLFFSEKDRQCKATEYARAKYPFTIESKEASWWLRSPGENDYCMAFINYDGSVRYDGTLAICDFIGVRPAVWITVETETIL